MVVAGSPSITGAEVIGKVKAVWDKGKAAVIETEGIVQDASGPLCTTTATLFVDGRKHGSTPTSLQSITATVQ